MKNVEEIIRFFSETKEFDIEDVNTEKSVCSYSRLWAQMLRKWNPVLWNRGVSLMRQSPVWKEVESGPSRAEMVSRKGDEGVAYEVFARLAGQRGKAYFLEASRSADSKEKGLGGHVKGWLRQAFSWVRDTLAPIKGGAAESLSLDEFLAMPMRDLLEGAGGSVNRKMMQRMKSSGDGLGSHRRRDYAAKLRKAWSKNPDVGEDEIARSLDALDALSRKTKGMKAVKVAFAWLVKGTVRLPEDEYKVVGAVSAADAIHVDLFQFGSPDEFFLRYPMDTVSVPPIDPDTVPTLTNKRTFPCGVTIYDVEESEESRRNMRHVIDTHFGRKASPWCLLAGDGNGNLTPESARAWKHYSGCTKRVAFQDGKLIAFCANSDRAPMWWDRMDRASRELSFTRALDGDPLLRTGTYAMDEKTGKFRLKGNILQRKTISSTEPGKEKYEKWIYDPEKGIDVKALEEVTNEYGKLLYAKEWKYSGWKPGVGFQPGKQFRLTSIREEPEQGPTRTYFPNGRLRSEKSDNEVLPTVYYSDGSIRSHFVRSGESPSSLYESFYSGRQGGGVKVRYELKPAQDTGFMKPVRYESFWPDGTVRVSVVRDPGRGGFVETSRYRDGSVRSETVYSGIYRKFSGCGVSVGRSHESIISRKRYYQDGAVKSTRDLNGWTDYYPDGRIKSRLVDHPVPGAGRKNGAVAEYFDESGKLVARSFYKFPDDLTDINLNYLSLVERCQFYPDGHVRSKSVPCRNVAGRDSFQPRFGERKYCIGSEIPMEGIRKTFYSDGDGRPLYSIYTDNRDRNYGHDLYDKDGRIREVVRLSCSRNHKTTKRYGRDGKLASVKFVAYSNAQTRKIIGFKKWTYNEDGTVTERVRDIRQGIVECSVLRRPEKPSPDEKSIEAYVSNINKLFPFEFELCGKADGAPFLSTKKSVSLDDFHYWQKIENRVSEELKNDIIKTLFGENGLVRHVGGALVLRSRTGLSNLPENLEVEGFLDLFGCTGLSKLPDNLKVGGNLNLAGCTDLTELPENLEVGGDLVLTDCPNLTCLPKNLKVERKIRSDSPLKSFGAQKMFETFSQGGDAEQTMKLK